MHKGSAARATAAAVLGCLSFTAPAAQGAEHAEPVSVAVAFDVENINRSSVACSSDGRPYRLHAELVGPRHALEGSAPATAALYLHEYSYDDFWHFRSAPDVDYATELARAGYVSVALDRLGYDDSPHPDGSATCIGAQVDMAHQIVAALRTGSYVSPQLPPRRFERVVLGGHSVGGIIAELEAAAFRDVDALMLFAGYHADFTPRALGDGLAQGRACAAGGEESGGAPNYAPFAPSEQDFREYGFVDADPAVVEAAWRLRHLDPCGDVHSLVPAAVAAGMHIDEIDVPVLLLWGRDDPVYTDDAGENQAADFSGSDDVTTVYFERTAHAMTLDRSAPQLRAAVSDWLGKRGFGTEPAPLAPSPRLWGCGIGGTVLVGTVGRDALRGTPERERLFGLRGRDSLAGKAGRDCLSGGRAADGLVGGRDADRLLGGRGPDRLVGGRGADRLLGGRGRDRLAGGAGADALLSRDGTRDIVRCGKGRDRAVSDRVDSVRGCERVSRR